MRYHPKNTFALILISGIFFFLSCSGKAYTDPTDIRFAESGSTVPDAPVLTKTVNGNTLDLAWSGNGAKNFTLYFAPYPSGSPVNKIDMGQQTSLSMDLPNGDAYYIGVTASNSAGESQFSNIEYFIIDQDTYDYLQAIKDAGIIEPDEIVPLPAINDPTVQVVTWTEYPDSYPAGQEAVLQWGDVWITLAGDVQSLCKKFDKTGLVSDIEKLLGLPPGSGEDRVFVTLEVNSEDMFRPCSDPDITTEKCPADFPDGVSLAHQAWFAQQCAVSYQTNPGYPWTRLGYTYNWKKGAGEVGPAEFVVRKGSSVLSISIQETDAYCTE